MPECGECKEEFELPPGQRWRKEKRDNLFCSQDCYQRWKKGENHPRSKEKLELECEYCGSSFERHESISDMNDKDFCSVSCVGKWQSENRRGKNHPRWNGGYKYYRGKNWESQRRKALKRDNHECQNCGSEKNLQVHHIVPFSQYGLQNYRKANKLENLITLCKTCHIDVERGDISLEVDRDGTCLAMAE